jgi:site-specific DNA recombinase
MGHLLRNAVYAGDAVHQGQAYPGEHPAIIERAIFDAVQARLAAQQSGVSRCRSAIPALLMGRIFDSAGNRMTPSHANKTGVRYGYYVSRAIPEGRKAEAGDPARIPALEIEEVVMAALRRAAFEARDGQSLIPEPGLDQRADPGARGGDAGHYARDEAASDAATTLAGSGLESVAVYPGRLVLRFSATIAQREDRGGSEDDPATNGQGGHNAGGCRSITIPWAPAHAKPRRSIVDAPSNDGGEPSSSHRQLIIAIQNAHIWMQELTTGKAESIETIAKRAGKHPRSIRTTLSLAFLAPDILDRLIRDGLPSHVMPTELTRSLPPLWADQRALLG